ncbi:hypothetical protein GCM10010869_53440 [Mesorhizobium tianshanense]|uniref:Class 3 adenylate cyclase n=1 Tax=Mesorhizobium tianshanense TaxID=39844 RepID=A0A562N788_9HYPH|nr:hypothetical protein [Mesorhizobium tianshanense]TWI27996.1 hypothetical protein IQ26_05471 [Mesorhizobium tianshanense]GLS39747.1 hypothetical protein GCM10010869_53440 [Mesorhizobium tianshanense]
MATDVVGYSRLVEANEESTLVALRHEFFDPTVVKHGGRMFKVMGDGFLVEFGSVINAARCAVEIQRGMVERNMGFLRIGTSSSASGSILATSSSLLIRIRSTLSRAIKDHVPPKDLLAHR